MPGDPAVFIDRDGTLTEEVGYLNHPKRLRLIPRSAEAVSLLNRAGMKAVVATNQSGIARGYFTEEILNAIHAELLSQLKAEGAALDGIYVCMHHPTEGERPYRRVCDCRKPGPGLLHRAAADLGLDLQRSYAVGDKISDVVAGHRAGARGVLVLTGYGLGEWEHRRSQWTDQPDHVAEDLLDAVRWILNQSHRERDP
jgi:D-glycero-D-manno-heptose 1,7-bisphosphate phosphatase